MSKRKNIEDGLNTSKKNKFDFELIDAFIEETTTTTNYILSNDPKNEDINEYYKKIQELEKELKNNLEKVQKKRKILNYNNFVNVGNMVFLGGYPGLKTILDIIDCLDIKSILNFTGFFSRSFYKKFNIKEMNIIKGKYNDKITEYINSLRIEYNNYAKQKHSSPSLPIDTFDWYGFIPHIFNDKYKTKYDNTTKKILIKYLYLNNKLHFLDIPWNNKLVKNIGNNVHVISSKGFIFINNNLDIIKYLSKYKVKFGICDNDSNTCLNIAILYKSYDIVKYLLNTNLNCVEGLLKKNKYDLHILHFALNRNLDNNIFDKLLEIILEKNKLYLYNEDILRIKIKGYKKLGGEMTILDYCEFKDDFEYPKYYWELQEKYDPNSYKIKKLKEYGAVRNIYRSVEKNDKYSLKYWINNIQNISDMNIGYPNYYLLPKKIEFNMNKYLHLKLFGNVHRKWYSKINPLDLSYMLGKNDCSTILIKNGIIINKIGFLHIINELKDIDLVKFWIDKCKFNLHGILTEIYDFEIIDSKIERIIEFLKGKNATFHVEEAKINFAFKAVLHEDLNKLKELLKHEFGNIYDKKIKLNEKYINQLFQKRQNLLHFAILNNQKNFEIIEYLSLFNNSCLLREYKKSSKTTLGIFGLIQMRLSKPKYKNNKYKELTNKIFKFYKRKDMGELLKSKNVTKV